MPIANRAQLVRLLQTAGHEMVERGDRPILSDFDTCAALGSFLLEAARRINNGDDSDATRVWDIFAPTCEWDDAGGSQALANSIFALIDPAWRPDRGRTG